MGLKRISTVIFIVLGLVGLIVILYSLDYLGFLDLKPMAAKVPFLQKYVTNIDKTKSAVKQDTDPMDIKLLEEENKQLRNENKSLQRKVKFLTQEKETLAKAKDQLEIEYQDLLSQNEKANPGATNKDSAETNYDKLAQYYAQMKPDAAVKIMDNLDDPTVIGILNKLDDEQVSKILSKMDPKRAASLVKQMTN